MFITQLSKTEYILLVVVSVFNVVASVAVVVGEVVTSHTAFQGLRRLPEVASTDLETKLIASEIAQNS